MPRIGIIGGSGLEELLQGSRQVTVQTPFGPAPPITIGTVGKQEIAFLPRHGPKHDQPPHMVNYRANLSAMKKSGIERIIATNAVGAINPEYAPGDVAIPEDILDFTKRRAGTFFDGAPVTHVDMSQPYCPELRRIMGRAAKEAGAKVRAGAVMAATEGPRYETPAEIRMLHKLGGDVVGMTGAPEAFLAREQEVCYATLCFISNRAAGMQDRLSAVEVMDVGNKVKPLMLSIIIKTVENIPVKRTCPCSRALGQARV